MKRTGVVSLMVAAGMLLALTAAAQGTAPVPKVTDIPAPGTGAITRLPVTQTAAAAPNRSGTRPLTDASTIPAPDMNTGAEVETVAPPVALTARPKLTAAAVATAHTATGLIVPAGTPIALQLETQLNTQYSAYGDGFAARVMTPVYYQRAEVIPSGAILEGHVMHVQDARPMTSQSELLLKPDLLVMPDGEHYTISAEVIQNDPHSAARVDTEGMLREPRGMLASDIHHTEIGGAGGFIGGAVLAGGQGAMVGAGLGAAVAVGIWLVRRRHLALNPGSHLTVRLQRAIQLRPAVSQ